MGAAGQAAAATSGGANRSPHELKGADLSARGVALEALAGVSHYLIGSDPTRWRSNVPHYARVEYPDVYLVSAWCSAATDLASSTTPWSPRAPTRVPSEVEFEGGLGVSHGPSGELVLKTRRGEIRHSPPLGYQEGQGGKRAVPVSVVQRGAARVSFEVPRWDRSRNLVIDSEITYVATVEGAKNDVP